MSIVVLNEHVHSITKTTKSGNSTNDVTDKSGSLLDRIEKDHKDFRKFTQENLRDTSANLIRRNSDFGPEVSHACSLRMAILSVRTTCSNSIPTSRSVVYSRACRWLEELFRPVLKVTPDNPFPAERKLGGQRSTDAEQRKSIQRLEQQGLPAKEIAQEKSGVRPPLFTAIGVGTVMMPCRLTSERRVAQTSRRVRSDESAACESRGSRSKDCRVGRGHDLHCQSVLEEEISHVRTAGPPGWASIWDTLGRSMGQKTL